MEERAGAGCQPSAADRCGGITPMQLMEEGAQPETGGSGGTERVYAGIGGLGSDPERAEDTFPRKRLKPQNRPLPISPSPASASERGKAAKTQTAAPPSRPPGPIQDRAGRASLKTPVSLRQRLQNCVRTAALDQPRRDRKTFPTGSHRQPPGQQGP